MKGWARVVAAGWVAIGFIAFASCGVSDRNVHVAKDASAGGLGGQSGAAGSAACASASGGTLGTRGGSAGADPGDADAGLDASLDTSLETAVDAGVPLDQFCSKLMVPLCQWAVTCGVTSGRCSDWPMYTRIQAICVAAPAAVAAGRLRYDPIQAEACLKAVDPRLGNPNADLCTGGGSVLVWSFNRGIDNACTDVFTGLVPNGGDCYTESSIGASECKDGYCSRVGNACPGVCARDRKVGESCTPSGGVPCERSTFCNVNFCAARRTAGEACNADSECKGGLVCAALGDAGPQKQCMAVGVVGDSCLVSAGCFGFLECVGGKCVDRVSSGAACRDSRVCPTNQVCVFGSPLNTSGTCAAPVAAGARCGRDAECAGFLPPSSGTLCLSPNGTAAPVCMPPAGLNQPCGGACPGPCGRLGCQVGLYCELGPTGVCKTQLQPGVSCTRDNQCSGDAVCATNLTCLRRGGLGEPCDPAKTATCGTGLFCERQNKTCVAPRLNLEQCTPVWQSCKSGLFCACNHGPCDMFSVDFSKPSPTEVCEFQALDGESCTFAGKCLNGYCVNGKCASFPAYSFCDGIDDPKPDSGSGDAH